MRVKPPMAAKKLPTLPPLFMAMPTVVGELPDDDEVSNAGNGVPAPLLRGALSAVGGEETGQDHDQVSDDGDQDAAAVHASEQAQVEQQERGGDGPVDVTGVVDLTVDVVGGVRDVLVRLALHNVVVASAVAAGHGEVGQSSGDGDQRSDNVIQTLRHRHAPGHAGEDDAGDQHDNEDNP